MGTEHTVEETAGKIDRLGLWDALMPCHWAIKPLGSAVPFFCAVAKGEAKGVKVRLLLLEGWQTFHDYVRFRVDRFFGFYLSPFEMPHYELIVFDGDAVPPGDRYKLFRNDPGYVQQEVTDGARREFCAKLLWQVYGLAMRLEAERNLPLRYSEERAVFSRMETKAGTWEDAPLEIPTPRAHTEQVSFPKDLLSKVKDLPLENDGVLDVDFRMLVGVMTREKRPRCVYALVGVDPKSGNREIFDRVSVDPEQGLRGIWETMPRQLLFRLSERGRVPGEIRTCSVRVFRLLRPLCIEIPFKLSLHDSLPAIGG